MSDMRRREFTALVGGVGLLLAVKVRRARAQQSAKIPRIGILDDAPMWQTFRQALRELGYVEGQNIAYEYRYGEGAPDRLATVAAEPGGSQCRRRDRGQNVAIEYRWAEGRTIECQTF